MLQKYLPALAALICYPLAYIWPSSAILCLPITWTALLLWAETEQSFSFKIGLGLVSVFLASLFTEQWGLLQGIAWLIYVLGKGQWGKQRAFFAFLFLFLSAEALPYYSGLSPKLSLPLYLPFWDKLEFWAPWFLEASNFATSFLVLFTGLLGFFLVRQMQTRPRPSWLLIGLITLSLLVPVFISLSVDEDLSGTVLKNSVFGLNALDQFIARLSFFLAFFLLLFAVVRKLLPEKNADDRFT